MSSTGDFRTVVLLSPHILPSGDAGKVEGCWFLPIIPENISTVRNTEGRLCRGIGWRNVSSPSNSPSDQPACQHTPIPTHKEWVQDLLNNYQFPIVRQVKRRWITSWEIVVASGEVEEQWVPGWCLDGLSCHKLPLICWGEREYHFKKYYSWLSMGRKVICLSIFVDIFLHECV